VAQSRDAMEALRSRYTVVEEREDSLAVGAGEATDDGVEVDVVVTAEESED